MARALVTGGAGFIGSHLVGGLLEAGHQVRVLDDFSSGSRDNLAGLDVDLLEADVRQAAAVEEAVADCNWVFHLAAMISLSESLEDPVGCYATNLTASVQLLEAARRAGVRRVILSSSCAVYGQAEGPVTEGHRPSPLSPYAASKLAMEQAGEVYAQTLGLPVFSLRYFNVYGPRQRAESDYAAVIPQFIQKLTAGHPLEIHGDGRQTRDFVFVGDVVRANLLPMAAGLSGGTFNIGSGRSTSVLELASALQELLPAPGEPSFGPARAGDIRHSQANLERARHDLGYQPQTDLERGLEATVEWFVANHEVAKGTKGGNGGTKGGGQVPTDR